MPSVFESFFEKFFAKIFSCNIALMLSSQGSSGLTRTKSDFDVDLCEKAESSITLHLTDGETPQISFAYSIIVLSEEKNALEAVFMSDFLKYSFLFL